MNLGFTKAEAKVYFYLAKRGPKKASEIAKSLKMTRQQLYVVAKRLQSKAIVNATMERPVKFSAVPLNKVLDMVAKAKFEEAKIIEANKGNLLSDWKLITIPVVEDNTSKFTVITGRNHVHSKIQQMILDSQNQISIVSPLSSLLRIDEFGVLDIVNKHPHRSKIQFRFVTEILHQDIQPTKYLIENLNSMFKVKARNTDIGLSLFPKMVIRDNEELLCFISPKTNQMKNADNHYTLLTNCTSIVKPFVAVFENLWQNSIDIEEKIIEIETGQPVPITRLINDAEAASKELDEKLNSAKREILIVTSSKGLLAYWKKLFLLKKLVEKGVSIKIMAPISRENLKECLDLSEFCEVRHIPNEYVKTIIIDGKHLFQFKIPESQEKKKYGITKLAFYSNDFEYVEKTKKMLLDIWKRAVIPSAVTAGSIIVQQLYDSQKVTSKNSKNKFVDVVYASGQFYPKAQPNKIKEKDVISEIEKYKKSPKRINKQVDKKDIVLCGTIGYAVIRSHPNFDFPDMFITAYDIDEESTFGAEDALVISLEMKEVSGRKHYVPVTVVGDNPKASDGWKISLEGATLFARDNYHLFEKDEIHVQSLGNTFFAGWTKPIPLLSAQKLLPPSALMLEATGKIRSESFRINVKGALNQQHRFNYSDAFVTFFHQKTKYHGPSTDGSFLREMYLTNI
jgi:sugar-specific transcriptional regulator TrmB